MALIGVGSGGASWRAADWVARNAFAFLIPALERAGAASVARECGDALAAGAAGVDLRELLDEARTSERWTLAVDAALAAIEAEDSSAWNEPARFEQFVALVAELRALARRDGNALVVSLAVGTTEKIDAPTP